MLFAALRRRGALRRSLRRDRRGVTIVEFALILPVLMILIVGCLDVGHYLYARSLLNGAMQAAGREAALESGIANADVIDQRVQEVVGSLMQVQRATTPGVPSSEGPSGPATIQFTRRHYTSFDDVGLMEEMTDSDADDVCDKGEPYVDANGSGTWDQRGSQGQGGARATVLYTATLAFDRLFPLHKLVEAPPRIVIKSETILRNQPYDQAANIITPVASTCPLADL